MAKEKTILLLLIKYLYPRYSSESISFTEEKALGIFFTGLIPLVLFIFVLNIDPGRIGVNSGKFHEFWYLYLILPSAAILISFISSKKPGIQVGAPQLRIKNWHFRHIFLTLILWSIYLLGYEFFFRGVLWSLCYSAFNFHISLFINVSLYSFVHFPKGKMMMIGAVPFGILLCFLSFITGSFFAAFLVHSSMAIATELSSVYHNPDFQFIKGKVTIKT